MDNDAPLRRRTSGDFTLTDTRNDFRHAVDPGWAPFLPELGRWEATERARLVDDLLGGSRTLGGADFTALRAAAARHGLTCRELVLGCLLRIRRLNPYHRAVLELNPRALQEAAARDEAGHAPGSGASGLAGLPFLAKGNIAVEGLPNDAGSHALRGEPSPADAEAVRRLRQAGAVVLGRANMSEFANYVSWNMPNGFSGVGGQTLSPHGPRAIDPWGSSTGSATALALGLAAFTLGTETHGSIIAPAAVAGVAALKPTTGSWPAEGVVPLLDAQDTVGPLGRTLADVADVERAVTGRDPADADLAGARFVSVLPEESPAAGILGAALAARGAALVPASDRVRSVVAELVDQHPDQLALLVAGARRSLDRHLAAHPEYAARSLADVVAFMEGHPELFPYGFDLLAQARDGHVAPETAAALTARARDTLARLAVEVSRQGDYLLALDNDVSSGAIVGYPRATVPLWRDPDTGVPHGVTMVGLAPDTDAQLLGVMLAVERALGAGSPRNR